eukprot:3293945-Prorocentrum_lima.AAC.1
MRPASWDHAAARREKSSRTPPNGPVDAKPRMVPVLDPPIDELAVGEQGAFELHSGLMSTELLAR